MKTNTTTDQKTSRSSVAPTTVGSIGSERKKRFNLFDHQVEGIQFLIDKGHAIMAHEMGLGKTKMAVIAAGEVGEETTLVVCPASLKINWEREIHMVYPEDVVAIVQGGKYEPINAANAGWIVVNYDVLGKNEWILELAKNGCIGTLIIDEAHYIKDTKAIRTKALLAITEHAKRVYLLTGTPVMNRPIELFALLRAVKHPLAYKDDEAVSTLRKAFGKRYCGAYFHRLGFTGRGFWDESGATRLPELREMTRDVFLRRTKAEVLDLPEKIVSVVNCELGPEWKGKYDRAWDEYLTWLAAHPDEKKDIGNIMSAQALIELGKLKQVCSQAKILRICDDIENAIEQDQKVIVFTQFTATVERIQATLLSKKIKSVTLTGATQMDDRQHAVDAFQNDPEFKVFIANIKAGGIGLTLTAASIVMFADMEWSPTIHAQAEDRAHRIGQTGTVNVYYYIAEGTIEEDIIDILTSKQETIGILTDGETTIRAFMDRLIDKIK